MTLPSPSSDPTAPAPRRATPAPGEGAPAGPDPSPPRADGETRAERRARRKRQRAERFAPARGPRLLRRFSTIDRSILRGNERWIIPLIDNISARPRLKDLYFRVVARWFWRPVILGLFFGRRLVVDGAEHLRGLKAPRGIFAVANHRTFFDMYIFTALCVHWHFTRRIASRFYFPVRTSTWYDSYVGAALNLSVSFGSMWPPIFRDERRFKINPIALEQIAGVLDHGTLVGIHPEGTRNKGDNPWDLLPARRGIGSLVRGSHDETQVVPLFIGGLGGNLLAEVRANYFAPQTWPLRVRIGQPLRAAEVRAEATDDQQLAEALMARVAALAAEDRAIYEGKLPAASPSEARGR